MYEKLPIEILDENPLNSNRISRAYSKKLQKNIGNIGYYETLTVRRHPKYKGRFEIINGHARFNILRELGIENVKCDIWDVDDSETQLFLAILNKLRGAEVPELRMSLLYELLQKRSKDDLAAQLPESLNYLSKLEGLPEKLEKLPDDKITPDIIIINFYLNSEQHTIVNCAIRNAIERYGLSDSAQGISKIAEIYLKTETVE